jgi:hypothetical protein
MAHILSTKRQFHQGGMTMKRVIAACGLLTVLMLALSAVGFAQTKGADFAGTWTLDKSKSQLPQMMADRLQGATWTITQDDKQLTREQKLDMAEGGGQGGGGGRGGGMMGGGGPLTVKFDGSETVSETQRGKATSKVKWNDGGKILEVKTIANVSTPNGDFTSTTTEHWELADGGKTLKVHRVSESQRGTMESTWVFTKK